MPKKAAGIASRALLAVFALCLLLSGAMARAQDSATAQHLTVKLLVPPGQIYPGQSFTAGLDFQMEPGWHIYWINAGDSGEPPSAKWTLPSGVTAAPMQFPAPQRLPLGPLMDFGYEHQVIFPVPFHAAADFHPSAAQVPLTADLTWLVCREVCLPGKATLHITRDALSATPSHPAVDTAAQQQIAAFVARLPKPLPSQDAARFESTAKGFTLQVALGGKTSGAEFFPLDQNIIANAASQPVKPLGDGVSLSLTRDENIQGQPKQLNGLLELPDGPAYQIAATPGALPAAPAGSGDSELMPLLRATALAFLGGILLNLMPCVFPVLFIKGLALVQSSQHERRTMRAHGWVYALGILVSFWVVVAVLLILRGAGHELGWGFQFQSPVVLSLMAMLLFFLGLSLAGQFEIGLTLTSAGGSLAQKQGYAGSFFTGVLAMIVATPCTAPFMGAAIGYALAHSALTSFSIFTALALGLALPYLLLAYNPAWTRLLPRPGAWMEVLKQAISVPIFGTVIWLVWLYTQTAGANALVALLAAFLLLAVAGWVLGRWPAKTIATIAALVVVAAAVALPWYAADAVGSMPQAQLSHPRDDLQWQPFTPALLAKYRAEGKPVFVDFTAKWCLSCQVNERVVLDRPEVQHRLQSSGVQLLKADWTRHDSDIADALAQLGRSGVPTYALYSGSSDAPPHLLPEVLTPGIVYDALASIRSRPQATAALQVPAPQSRQ